MYRNEKRFTKRDFELAHSSGQLLGVALVRARRQTALQVEHDRLFTRNAESNQLIGDSKPMQRLKSKIARVGKANGCVLVRGESGAGKELVARAVHNSSPRRERPMLSVNCCCNATEPDGESIVWPQERSNSRGQTQTMSVGFSKPIPVRCSLMRSES